MSGKIGSVGGATQSRPDWGRPSNHRENETGKFLTDSTSPFLERSIAGIFFPQQLQERDAQLSSLQGELSEAAENLETLTSQLHHTRQKADPLLVNPQLHQVTPESIHLNNIISQYITVHHSISQYITVHLSISQYITVYLSISQYISVYHNTSQYITVYHSISQYISVYHSTSQYITIHHSTSQYITVYHSISQYITVYYKM